MVNERVTSAVAACKLAPPAHCKPRRWNCCLAAACALTHKRQTRRRTESHGSQVISDLQIWMASLAVQLRALGAQLEDRQRVRLAIALIAARDQVDVARDFPNGDSQPGQSLSCISPLTTHCAIHSGVQSQSGVSCPASRNGR